MIGLPWPFANRDFIVDAFGVDMIEQGKVLVQIKVCMCVCVCITFVVGAFGDDMTEQGNVLLLLLSVTYNSYLFLLFFPQSVFNACSCARAECKVHGKSGAHTFNVDGLICMFIYFVCLHVFLSFNASRSGDTQL